MDRLKISLTSRLATYYLEILSNNASQNSGSGAHVPNVSTKHRKRTQSSIESAARHVQVYFVHCMNVR